MVVLGTFDARGTTLPYLHACLNSALTDEAALHKNQNVMTGQLTFLLDPLTGPLTSFDRSFRSFDRSFDFPFLSF